MKLIQPTRLVVGMLRLTLLLGLLAACTAAPTPTATVTPAPTATPTTIPSPTPALTPTPEPAVDAVTMNQRIGRAVNIGNALEAPNEGAWGVIIKDDYFTLLKGAGFTAIRLPVSWNSHTGSKAPYTIDPVFMDRVDHVIQTALAQGLVVIVNDHNYDELMKDPAGQTERFKAIWKQLAEHYQAYPQSLLFELMNEPNSGLSDKIWNGILAHTLSVVRASNPDRNVVIGPVQWNNYRALQDLKLPTEDQHIIVTFHYYDPFQFTHQGAEWVNGADAWLGTQWAGSGNDKSNLKFDFDTVAQWAKDNNRPIFLGEFGAYNKANLDDRARWTAFVARQAEAHNFSWSYWECCAGFGFYDPSTGQWNEQLLQALIPPK